jgi:hypothetical protein
VDSDAQRYVAWLKHQVSPGLRRVQEWYDRADLIALLFDGLALEDIRPRSRKEEVPLPSDM